MVSEDIPSFHVADYVVFAASIVFSLGIGIYHAFRGGQQKTTSEYILGNRQLKVLPVAMSLIVSYESSILMLGFPAETYMYGFQFSFASFAWCIASIMSTFLFVPTLYAVKTNSIYELYERRFRSKNVRLLGNISQTIAYIVFMGIVLFGPAISLEAVTGFPVYLSIILIAIVAMVYTSVGGIRAVVWADLFQSIVMVAGLLAILIKGTMVVGGVGEVVRRNRETGRTAVNFNPDPTVRLTFWTMSAYIVRYSAIVFDQASFQRISSTPTVKTAKMVYLLSGPGFLIFGLLGCMVGSVAYAYFHYKQCDPLASGRLKNPNQIVILLVLELYESLPGMSGLFLAALFSSSLRLANGLLQLLFTPLLGPMAQICGMTYVAAIHGLALIEYENLPRKTGFTILFLNCVERDMIDDDIDLHTLSSGMGSVSTIFWEDIVKPRIGRVSEARATLIAKIAVFGCGSVSVVMSLLIAEVGGSLGEISSTILGAASAPLTGLCFIAVLIPSIHSRAAIGGMIISSGIAVWLSLGTNMSKHLMPDARLPAASTDLCIGWNSTILISNQSVKEYVFPEPDVTGKPIDNPGLGYKVLYTLSPFIYNPLIIVVTIVLSFVLSLVLGRKEEDRVDEIYIVPAVRRLCCSWYLRKYIRRKSPCYEMMTILKTRGEGTQVLAGEKTIDLETQSNHGDQEGNCNKGDHPKNNIHPQ